MGQFNRSGGVGLGLLFLLVAGAAFWGGGQGVYTGLRNLSPTSITMEEYLLSGTRAAWLEIHDAYFHVADAAHRPPRSGPRNLATDRIFIPVHASQDEAEVAPPRVVLETGDRRLIALYNEIRPNMEEDEVRAWIERHERAVADVDPIRGLVRFGIELNDEERQLLSDGFETDEFIVLMEGEEPRIGGSLLALLVGFLALGLSVWQFGRADGAPGDTP